MGGAAKAAFAIGFGAMIVEGSAWSGTRKQVADDVRKEGRISDQTDTRGMNGDPGRPVDTVVRGMVSELMI